MRTTVSLDKDVAAAVKRLRREDGLGVSEALNQIARAGLAHKEARTPFRQRTVKMGLLVDVSNVAEAIELAEGASHR